MKQLIQYLDSGRTELLEAPSPSPRLGHLLIETRKTLISAGTERMLINFGKASYLQKAKQQPEKVKQVLDKIKTDGLVTTVDAVRSKLAEPIPLGYCNVGRVYNVGKGVVGLVDGDRVVSNGPHADIVRVPKHLCAKVPDNVDDESAAFTVLASIALQGMRLANPTLGETVVVTGAGLIGLLAVQLLIANGCRVLAVDFDDNKLALAKQFGAQICNPANGEDPVKVATQFSRGRGIDAVLITASTQSSEPVSQAAQMSRKRGRIVLVGVTGLALNRAEFYEKELTFQVSCSYGPGRYDPNYEEKGEDYPLGFVRWTEQRNFEAILDMMSMGSIDVKPLITHTLGFADAAEAYDVLSNDPKALGIVLDYGASNLDSKTRRTLALKPETKVSGQSASVAVIGAGNYASRMLIPAFKHAGATLQSLVTSGGVSGAVQGDKHDFTTTTTDTGSVFDDDSINTVAIATRHDSHAAFTIKALSTGKHVFVEKPLAITRQQLDDIQTVYRESHQSDAGPLLMVGFNRRFAPFVQKAKQLLDTQAGPKSFIFTVNAGHIPRDHWTQDPDVGGGRIIGEACHFIDLMRFLADAPIAALAAQCLSPQGSARQDDVATISLTFEDGSVGSVHYFANGANAFPKERLEVFSEGKILSIDNYRKMTGYGWSGFSSAKSWKQDKGHSACANAFIQAIHQGGGAPISADELFEVSAATLEAAEQLMG